MALLTTTLLAILGINGTLYPGQAEISNDTSFDYIIIGGGTAGCVLARRLSEDKNSSVLVLEAGDDPNVVALFPALFPFLPSTELDYDYTSTFNDYAARGQGNYTKITAGKMLGGSASLNHHVVTRGVPKDFDNWANITGDDSWSYENLLKYFIKSETLKDKEVESKYPDYHGTEGPSGITRQTHDSDVADYLASFAEAGNPTVLDFNADTAVGYTQPLLFINGGLRQTPALTYLRSIKDYPNLAVSKNTRGSRIIFENDVAVGVEAVYKDTTYKFRANKEVILSAGTFNSPQVLMLSGVGPKEHLDSLKINVVADLPVGDNLIIPTAVVVVYATEKHFSLINVNLGGTLAVLNPTQIPFPLIVGSVALNKSDTTPNYQTYNLLIPHGTPFLELVCTPVYGYRSEICSNWKNEVKGRDIMYTVILNLEPKSRGTVRLNSTHPADAPKITTGFYNDMEDLDRMLKNVKDFTSVGNTKYFKEIEAEVVGLDLPECADKDKGSDEFWTCYILNRSISDFVYTSTCPMGTVVDSQLKVKGLKNLRVVDASVMPFNTHGASSAAVIALAEKAADMIKNSA